MSRAPPTLQPQAPDFDSADYEPVEVQRAELIQECVGTILALVDAHLTIIHSRRRETTEAVDFALGAALEAVDMLHIAREEQPVTAKATFAGSWEVERPPQPCGADTWLRAAIPETQLPPKNGFLLNQFLAQQGSLRPTSKGSIKSSVSPSSRSLQVPRLGSPGKMGSTMNPPTVRQTSAQARAGRKEPSTLSGPVKVLTEEERQAEERLREELQIRKAQQQAARGLQAKDEEEKAGLVTLRKTLKGRDYSYDHRGKVVAMEDGADGGDLPSGDAPGPTFNVLIPGAEELVVTRGKNGRPDPTAAKAAAQAEKAAAKKLQSEKGTERKLVSDFRETPSRAQPSALDILNPTTGVTLRVGGKQRVGPTRPKATGLLTGAGPGVTREEYAKMVLLQQQARARAPAATFVAPAAMPTLNAASPPPRSLSPSMSSGFVGSPAAAPPPRPLPPPVVELPLEPLPPHLAGLSRRPAKAPPSPPQDRPDPVFELMRVGEWGTDTGTRKGEQPSPALGVAKPTERQRELEVGRLARLPRDRATMATMVPPLAPASGTPQEMTLGRTTMITFDSTKGYE